MEEEEIASSSRHQVINIFHAIFVEQRKGRKNIRWNLKHKIFATATRGEDF